MKTREWMALLYEAFVEDFGLGEEISLEKKGSLGQTERWRLHGIKGGGSICLNEVERFLPAMQKEMLVVQCYFSTTPPLPGVLEDLWVDSWVTIQAGYRMSPRQGTHDYIDCVSVKLHNTDNFVAQSGHAYMASELMRRAHELSFKYEPGAPFGRSTTVP